MYEADGDGSVRGVVNETRVTRRVLAIVGPTASGKSVLALRLAERLPVELVSCDSQQVYIGMDIGTGKATIAERRILAHHLLDVAMPTELFHAARWAALARTAVQHIIARGRVPLVVGGTGLYLRALLAGLFEAPAPEVAIRLRHRDEARRTSVEALHARLVAVDAETASQVQPRDLVRISRALEVYEQTGIPISVLRRRPNVPSGIEAATLILDPPLEVLREGIARRIDGMMKAGFLEETRNLRARFGSDARALQALGYKQLGAYLDGLSTLDDAVAGTKTATVAYARRQRTWFRKDTAAWRSEILPDPEEIIGWWNAGAAQASGP